MERPKFPEEFRRYCQDVAVEGRLAVGSSENMGVKGIRHASKELLKWPDIFEEYDLRMNLFSIYVFIEIGGTGGGCFRYMYSRFLKESAKITKQDRLFESAEDMQRSGEMFSEIGLLFKESEKAEDLDQ